jgi:hypothetical protein
VVAVVVVQTILTILGTLHQVVEQADLLVQTGLSQMLELKKCFLEDQVYMVLVLAVRALITAQHMMPQQTPQ